MGKAVVYDARGRMAYHPDFHDQHGEKFTEEDLEYMCKFWEVDGYKSIALALGRTEGTTSRKMDDLKKAGLYAYYRDLNKHW